MAAKGKESRGALSGTEGIKQGRIEGRYVPKSSGNLSFENGNDPLWCEEQEMGKGWSRFVTEICCLAVHGRDATEKRHYCR